MNILSIFKEKPYISPRCTVTFVTLEGRILTGSNNLNVNVENFLVEDDGENWS